MKFYQEQNGWKCGHGPWPWVNNYYFIFIFKLFVTKTTTTPSPSLSLSHFSHYSFQTSGSIKIRRRRYRVDRLDLSDRRFCRSISIFSRFGSCRSTWSIFFHKLAVWGYRFWSRNLTVVVESSVISWEKRVRRMMGLELLEIEPRELKFVGEFLHLLLLRHHHLPRRLCVTVPFTSRVFLFFFLTSTVWNWNNEVYFLEGSQGVGGWVDFSSSVLILFLELDTLLIPYRMITNP